MADSYKFPACAIVTALCVPAFAQDAPDGEAIEEIIVTGSRLPRRDFSATSPIATIDSETLTYSGQATLEESLNKMPQVAPDFGRTSNNPGNGTAAINLRGMGSGRTLVLLNGRRLAPSGVGGAVDVNNLPQALMERVEVITGGATTVYGSDAIAGVVNFITRDDFDGFALDTSAYMTEQGDSDIYDINVTWGHNFASGHGNVTLYAGYYDREPTFASQRAFTAESFFDTWEGTIVAGGSGIVPAGAIFSPRVDFGNGPARTTFDSNGNPVEFDPETDYYNFAPVNYMQIPLRRSSGGVLFSYDLTGTLETYAELSFARNEATQTLAPVPAASFFLINTDNPVLTPQTQQFLADNMFPEGPNLVSMLFGRRLLELGPRIIANDREYTRIVAGLRGGIGESWDFDAWVTYTRGDEDEYYRNDASVSRFQQGLLVDPATGQCFDPTGGCVPVNVFGEGALSPEALDFLRYAPFKNVTTREQKLVSAFVRGAPFSTWAGPVNLAFGLEWRSDNGDFKADDALFSDDTLGFRASASVVGSETVYEAYTEATIPLVEGAAWAEYLGLEIGGRYSDYEHAGGVETWKFGAEWQLPAPLKLRTMYQRSVRAPNLLEAFQEQGQELGTYSGSNGNNDPCSEQNDPVAGGIAEQCAATGIPLAVVGTWVAAPGNPTNFIFGGNPALEPEVANTLTAGVVLEFDWLQGMQASVDYFSLEVEDTIGTLDATLACFDAANTQNLFCGNFTRDPLTFDVVELYEPFVNRGRYTVKGIDTQLNLSAELPAGLAIVGGQADVIVNLVWTHTLENSYQETPFGTVFECAGTFGWPCVFTRDTVTYPENRMTMTTAYYSGDFSARLTWQWIEGSTNGLVYHKDKIGLSGIDLGLIDAPARSYLDLALGYRFTDHVTARLTVANVTDTSPAFLADYGSNNTDSSLYDLFGRAYTLSLSLEF